VITLVRNLIRALLYDELAVRRWIRGGLLWLGTLASQLMADPTWETWTLRQWLTRAGVAAIVGAGGMVTAGEKNPRTAQP